MSFTRRQILGGLAGLVVVGVGAGGASRYWLGVKAAHAHGKWVGVCGALASESLAVPMLVGLGVDELSVSVPLIPTIKARVRELEYKACQSLAQHVLGLESAEQVRAALQPSQPVNVAQSLVLEN